MAKIGRIGTRLEFEGKKEYLDATKEINSSLKNLGSEMKAVTYEFGRSDKSIEGLTKRKSLMEQQLEEQTKAVENTKKALEMMTNEGVDPASKQYQDMERVLRETESQMSGTKREIAELDSQLQSSRGNWENVGKVIEGVATALAAGMAAVGAAAVAAGAYLYNMASETAAAGNAVDNYSRQMGFSRDAIQEWDYILSQNGASLYNFNYGVRRVTAAMGSLDEEGGKVGKAITQLGLNFDEVREKSPEDAMSAIITAFQDMEEGADKTALSLQIFGQRGGMTLMPMLNSSAKATEELRQRAHDLGMVMSNEAIDASSNFTNSLDTLTRTFDGVKNAIGAQLLPGFTMVTDGLIGIISGCENASEAITQGVEELVNGINDAIPQVLELFNVVATTIAEVAPDIINALIEGVVNNIPQLMEAALSIVMALVEGIITALPALLEGAIQIITGLADGITQALPTLIPVVIDVIMQIVQTLMENIPLLIDAALQLAIGLTTGLIEAIPLIIEAIPQIIESILTAILESIPLIIQAGIDLLVALVEALPQIITSIVAAIPAIIEGIISALMSNLPLIIQAGVDLFIALIRALPEIITTIVTAIPQIVAAILDAIIGNLDQIIMGGVQLFVALIENLPRIIIEIVRAVPQIVTAIFNGFMELIPRLLDAGRNLMLGLRDGIINAATAVIDSVRDVASRISGAIRSFFGINSPSTLFAKYGKNMAEGLGQGFDREAKDVDRKMTGAMDQAGQLTAARAVEAVSNGIIQNISKLNAATTAVVEHILQSLLAENQRLTSQGATIVQQIATGITERASEITNRVRTIMQSATETINSFRSQFTTAGEEMTRGIWQGFHNMRHWLENNVRQMMRNIVAVVRREMQINSPSLVFADIGEQMAAGLGVGFNDEIKGVQNKIREATNSLTPDSKMQKGTKGQQNQNGGFSLTQIIQTKETSYAAQQREAAKNYKMIAREVGAI